MFSAPKKTPFLHLQNLLLLTTPFTPQPPTTAAASSLPSSSSQSLTIPTWKIQSSSTVGTDILALSSPDLDTSSWYATGGSKATLMATLLQNGQFGGRPDDASLFFSDTLKGVDADAFRVPWFYRAEFHVESLLAPPPRRGGGGNENSSSSSSTAGDAGKGAASFYYQIKTNGISSRADIFLNGRLVADNLTQVGAYTGLSYDVTQHILRLPSDSTANSTSMTSGSSGGGSSMQSSGKNVLLIKVYPTDYNRDFALGFVDWNPYPPDNGTGVWRDVEIVRTEGAVGIQDVSVRTELNGRVRFGVDVRRWDGGSDLLQGQVQCTILDPQGVEAGSVRGSFKFQGGGGGPSQQKVTLDTKLPNPQIWWPKQWGAQPLYNASCTASTPSSSSSSGSSSSPSHPIRFGIRTVSSSLNPHNDTLFTVNGHPFQVIGAGYTSDIFLRFDPSKLRSQFQLVLDMGLNTVRLEGKQEHAALYALADELGIMLLAGWECCDKWEGWTYNDEGSGLKWTDADYDVADKSMRHEASLMQSHPSMLAFLVGSDFWPDDRATKIYVDALRAHDWDVPIIASASQRGFPAALGNGGMKMDGPYDWVPPNYWYDDKLGAAFGFGSELGAGVGTPELASLKKFLSEDDMRDLWRSPKKGLYHMSTSVSSFYTREIYNAALWARYGAPTSLEDYLVKAQMADYEASRAEFDAYAARWTGVERPATGLIYWMLNNAWPSLHWNLFDYYLRAAGSYYGVKAAVGKNEAVVYDYRARDVYYVNRALARSGSGQRVVDVELMDTKGRVLGKTSQVVNSTAPNSSKKVGVSGLGDMVGKIQDVAFLRIVLRDGGSANGTMLSRNVYWLSAKTDVLDWDASTWYHTPVTSFADYKALNTMAKAEVEVVGKGGGRVAVENKGRVPAVFVRLGLVEESGEDVAPAMWSENYLTLWPGEKVEVYVNHGRGGNLDVEISGRNVDPHKVKLAGH
ncbi:glycoside hydrolase family 2 protein [Periconia macrospinosa]|uniref:Glycoside hydrolase family 2 protein n=1 Tax=Periconia macrospinosa TaxID=97972 RepID=A0A2V1D288_9PLEO|nr:glycoside hydrolase family 2 protein [Periconia macrospinosa]